MHYLLAAALVFGILTLWVPWILGGRRFRGQHARAGRWRDVPLASYRAAIRLPTGAAAVCRILGLAPVVDRADSLPLRNENRRGAVGNFAGGLHRRPGGISGRAGAPLVPLRHALFGFLVAALATLQTFTAEGKVFWIFQAEYTELAMGPILLSEPLCGLH
jgi:hypothetical protein